MNEAESKQNLTAEVSAVDVLFFSFQMCGDRV